MSEELHETKKKLLDAAECLFAAKGFEEVSVRELAAAADVNVAAVNYHFQGKENLFRQVILRRFVNQRDRTLEALNEVRSQPGPSTDIRPVLRTLSREYLTGSLSDPKGASFMKIMAREMHASDREGSSAFFQEMVRPIYQAYSEALLEARPHLNPEQISWLMASVVGQIQHFIIRWIKKDSLADDSPELKIMGQVFPALLRPVDQYIQEVTDHITNFSAAAIDTLYPENKQ